MTNNIEPAGFSRKICPKMNANRSEKITLSFGSLWIPDWSKGTAVR